MITNSDWIGSSYEMGDVCPEFYKSFKIEKKIKQAAFSVTAIGIYEAYINGSRIGDFIFAPGCTSYTKRLQYQTYDITSLLQSENEISIIVGKGWHRGRISKWNKEVNSTPCSLIAEIFVEYTDGTTVSIPTDISWSVRESNILFDDFFDGETIDASFTPGKSYSVITRKLNKNHLIPQEGVFVKEQERLKPASLIVTPKGERVIDFGQNLAGYVELILDVPTGTEIELSYAEILDDDGNFFTQNYRTAKSKTKYICSSSVHTYKSHMSFYGFRYIRLDQFPDEIDLNKITAIAVYSDMKRTGHFSCSNEKLNQFYSNVIWGQKSNYIDVPLDCPQRDERQPWLGDAQIFVKTAAYNYDVKRFFDKWIKDVCAEQHENGAIPDKAPNFFTHDRLDTSSAAWGDAITIVPWTIYQIYGDKRILEATLDAMKKYLEYIKNDSLDEYLWTCTEKAKELWGHHYGDWLALDTPDNCLKGATDDDVVASAFYACSTKIVIECGKALGHDMSEYEALYKNIRSTYIKRFNTPKTQTECVLDLYFDLTDDKKKTADLLAEKIKQAGNKLSTGFVGTPYLLYALSENGYKELAYELLLSEKCPSWLYEVTQGATTVWEHWDGIKDGKINVEALGMESYNHYAFGSVMDWVYTVAAGIKTDSNFPGFERAVIEPIPSKKLQWLQASLDTKFGVISSKWISNEAYTRYEITTPVRATIKIDNNTYSVEKGSYVFYGV